MVGAKHHWADVWVDDLEDRHKLQTKALFFIPSARELAIEFDQNPAGLASIANVNNKNRSVPPLAGIAVIRSVLGCRQPVTYDSALRFIRLLNPLLPTERHLSTHDIVACAFRLRDTEIVSELGVTPQMIAANCKLTLPVVKSAIKRMRITYQDAHDIWAYLSTAAFAKSKETTLSETVSAVITGDETSFIVSDSSDNYTLAVEKVRPTLSKHSKKGGSGSEATAEYVYNRSNLRAAPRSGHHWAIHADTGPAKQPEALSSPSAI